MKYGIWIPKIIRWILSILLCVGVYGETGIFTTVSIALFFIATELHSVCLELLRKRGNK